MKKLTTFLFLLVFITSCWNTSKTEIENTWSLETKTQDYIIWWKDYSHINIYGNILSDNTKTLVSHINWTIDTLNCEVWTKVTPKTLIAKILPDRSDVSYKSNSIQIVSLNEQLANQSSIKTSTLQSFSTQKNQLVLQKNNLETSLKTLETNLENLKNQKGLSSDDLDLQVKALEEQITNLETSKKLLEQNKSESVSDVKQSLENLKWQIYNTWNKAVNMLDEVFWVSEKNKDKDDIYEDYLWAKDSSLKSEVKAKILANLWDLGDVSDDKLSEKTETLSALLKDAAEVTKDSISSIGSLTQKQIDWWYDGFLKYSDALLTYKTNFDKLKNAVSTSGLGFDSQIQEVDRNLDNLKTQKENLEANWTKNSDLTFDTNINNLKTQIDSTKTSIANLDEQILNLEETQNSSIKQLDSQTSQLKDSISKTSVLLNWENIYAWIYGTIQKSTVNEWNFSRAWTALCMIVPKNNSLKLEIYSPEKLETWLTFNYLKNGEVLWTWTIVSESPVINSKTQNYTYKWNIDFSKFKAWDYLDVKVIKKIASNEIWIPLNYVFPKLDWYYVNLKNWENTEQIKVEIWKMNNWEIKIISWLENGDILSE